MTREAPTTCVVGDGYISAIAARALRDCGLPFECYASADSLCGGSGGAGGTGALAAEYLDGLVDRHGLRPRPASATRVRCARRIDNGAWSVHLESGRTRFFDAIIVTARPRLSPRFPRIAGAEGFSGPRFHSSSYRGEEGVQDGAVLVVGSGYAAETVAIDLAGLSRRVLLAPSPYGERVRLSQPGKLARYLSLCRHSGLRAKSLTALGGNRVRLVGEPVSIDGRTVRFDNGASAEIDVIVYATGFSPQFDFLSASLQPVGGHDFELYKRVFRPAIDNLFFVGSFLPAQAGQAALLQARLVAEYLAGSYALPELFSMRNRPPYDQGRVAVRMFDTEAGRSERALANYRADLQRELSRGRRRALRNSGRQPVPAIAADLRPEEEPLRVHTDSRGPAETPGQEPREQQGEQAAASIAAA